MPHCAFLQSFPIWIERFRHTRSKTSQVMSSFLIRRETKCKYDAHSIRNNNIYRCLDGQYRCDLEKLKQIYPNVLQLVFFVFGIETILVMRLMCNSVDCNRVDNRLRTKASEPQSANKLINIVDWGGNAYYFAFFEFKYTLC